MRATTTAFLAGLAAILLAGPPAQAGAGMPQGWRWYADDDALSPTPLALQNRMIWGVDPSTILRLRISRAYDILNDSSGLSLLYRRSGTSADSWTVGHEGAIRLADGLADDGAVIDNLLLAGSQTAGIVVESFPSGALPLSPTDDMLENEFALTLDPFLFKPHTRYLFSTIRTDRLGFPTESTGFSFIPNNPELCTHAGPPTLSGPEIMRWALTSVGPGGSLGDIDGDGELDLIQQDTLNTIRTVRYWRNAGSSTFEVGVPVRSGAGTLYLTNDENLWCTVDWEGDGDVDLAIWNNANRRLRVMRNDGTASFGSAVNIANSGAYEYFYGCFFTDWDDDGDLDLIVDAFFGADNQTKLMLQRNTGTRQNPAYSAALDLVTALGTPVNAYSFNGGFFEDFNGDGLRDLVGLNGPNLTVYANIGGAGSPSFDEQQTIELLREPEDLTNSGTPHLIDWDSDGDPDLVDVTAPAGMRYWENSASGLPPVFDRPPIYAQGQLIQVESPASPDVFVFPDIFPNFSLHSQLLIGDGQGRVHIVPNSKQAPPLLSSESLAMLASGPPLEVEPPAAPRVIDWLADGILDLLVGAGSGEVLLFVNSNTNYIPLFQDGVSIPTPGGTVAVAGEARPALGDLDGDGDLDLVVGAADGTISVFFNVGSGLAPVFSDGAVVSTGTGPLQLPGGQASVQIVDWDDDGHQDLLAGSGNGQVVFIANLDDGTSFGQPTELPVQLPAGAYLAVGDWDQSDCARDLLVGRDDGSIGLYRGQISERPTPQLVHPVRATVLDPQGQAFIDNPPALSWEATSDPEDREFFYRIEMSEHSDCSQPVVSTTETALRPAAQLVFSEPFAENRRYFWRLRPETPEGNLGAWSQIESFVIPPPGTMPVDHEPDAGPDGSTRMGRVVSGDFRSARAADYRVTGLRETDTLEIIEEVEIGPQSYRLLWFFTLEAGPLAGGMHPELIVEAQAGADEELRLEVHSDRGWRELGSIGETLTRQTFRLQDRELTGDRVFLRVMDAGSDSTPSQLRLDWCALTFSNQPPLADAGVDLVARPGEEVFLDGTGSQDPDGDELSYSWTQLSGPQVILEHADTEIPYFLVPAREQAMAFEFSLTVDDGEFSSSDTVSVGVSEPEPAQWGLQVSMGPNPPAAGEFDPWTTNVTALQLRLDVLGVESIRVESLRIDLEIKGQVDYLPRAGLVLDADGDGRAGEADTPLRALAGRLTDTLEFTDLQLTVAPGVPRYLLVRLNLPGPEHGSYTTAGAGPAFPAGWSLVLLGVALLAFSGRRRRLLACLLLVFSVACQRIGFDSWSANVGVGLTDNQAISAVSTERGEPVLVTGAPVLGPLLTVTLPQQEP